MLEFVSTGLQLAVPLLLASLGEIYAERSGVMNLGVEGMMSAGALASFAITLKTGNPALGLLTAAIVGAALSLAHAFISVTLRGNQVVSGLALVMVGCGLSSLIGRGYVGTPLPMGSRRIPALLGQDLIFYVSVTLSGILWLVLFRTRAGIVIRSVGENPAVADSVGVNVHAIRYLCTAFGGLLAGAAGGYISTIHNGMWVDGITAGMGWIAIALVIFATWDPAKAVGGAVLFGIVESAGYSLQNFGISQWLLNSLPYALTIVVLVVASSRSVKRRIGAPAALGEPYFRE